MSEGDTPFGATETPETLKHLIPEVLLPYEAFATSLLEKSPTENWRHEEATIAIERKRLRRVSFTIFYNLIEDNRRWRGGSSGSHSRSRHPCL